MTNLTDFPVRRRWMIRDYSTRTGECITTDPLLYWTRRGAERFAAMHLRWCGTRGGQYELRVERRP